MLSKHRDRRIPPTVIVLWGATGMGKTRRAYEIAEKSGKPFYVKPSDTKWWNGYNGESIAVLDEVAGQVPLPTLLCWLDRYPCAIESKGDVCKLGVTKWILTSNYHPETWYGSAGTASNEALMRRFTKVIHCTHIKEEMEPISFADVVVDLTNLSDDE